MQLLLISIYERVEGRFVRAWKYILILTVGFLLSTLGVSAEEKGSAAATDSLMTAEIGLGDLITWELYRLKGLKGDPQIELPQNLEITKKIAAQLKVEEAPRLLPLSKLQSFLKTKPTLSEQEKEQLLGVLRMANALLRSDAKDAATAFRDLTVEELKKIAQRTNGAISLPKDLQEALKKASIDAGGKEFPKNGLSAAGIAKIISDPKFDPKSIKEKDWAGLLGNVRAQSPRLRGDEFLGDFKADVWDDKIAELPKLKAGEEMPKNPFKAFNRSSQEPIQEYFPNQSENQSTPKTASHFVPEVNLPALRNFITPPPSFGGSPLHPGQSNNFGDFGGGSQGGGIAMDLDRLGDGVGDISSRAKQKKAEGAFSVLMRTSYEGQQAGTVFSCQITMVKEEKIGDKCSYTGATAKHCIRDEKRPTARMTHIEIDPFGKLEPGSYKTLTDQENPDHDFALVQFKSQCRSVTVVPLKKTSLETKKPPEIIVDTVRGTLIGKAKDAVGGNSLLALDVRSPVNGGLGIYPGDSGGGVATIGENGQLELAGVISSKPTDPALHGIGFFAAKDSMAWAISQVEGARVAHADFSESSSHSR